MTFSLDISPITTSELIAIQALLELRTEVRVYNKIATNCGAVDVDKAAPSCSGVSNVQGGTKKPDIKQEYIDQLAEPSTSRQTSKRKSDNDTEDSKSRRSKLPKNNSSDTRMRRANVLPNLDYMESMIFRLHQSIDALAAQVLLDENIVVISAYEDSSDDDEVGP